MENKIKKFNPAQFEHFGTPDLSPSPCIKNIVITSITPGLPVENLAESPKLSVTPRENSAESQGFGERVDAIKKSHNSRKELKSLTRNEPMTTNNAHVPIIRYSLQAPDSRTPSGQILDSLNPSSNAKNEIPNISTKKKVQSVKNLLLEKNLSLDKDCPEGFIGVETVGQDDLSPSREDPGSSGPALVKTKSQAWKKPPKLDNSKNEENISIDGRSNWKFRDYVSYSTASLGLKVSSSARKLCQSKQELSMPIKRRDKRDCSKISNLSPKESKK